jgi:nicotinamidase-related amidase
MAANELPIPPHYNPQSVGEVWKVPYQERAENAQGWARQHKLQPAFRDRLKISLLLIDVQNTFCIPDFELYVGGTSGTGAVDDNRRLCEFIYRNLNLITEICPTMDTHQVIQIFHSIFLVNDNGEHPTPYTLITPEDIKDGIWKFNRELSSGLQINEDYGQEYLLHYTQKLKEGGKYDLTIWPYHAMLGGIGHALVSTVEEAVFFHSIARLSQPDFQVSGSNPFTESYSALSAEVLEGPKGEQIDDKNVMFTRKLLDFDAVIIAGQAKSHCVAWTIDDLLNEIYISDKKRTEKVYLLEDCTSPVVIPDVIDYTEPANEAFQKFADAGMHIVRSTDPIVSWPGMKP